MNPKERARQIALKSRLAWADPTRLREEGDRIDGADWHFYVQEVKRRHIGRDASGPDFQQDPGQVHHCAVIQETTQRWNTLKLFSVALHALRLRSYEDGIPSEQHTAPLGASLVQCHAEGATLLDFEALTPDESDQGEDAPAVIRFLRRFDLPDTADAWQENLNHATGVDTFMERHTVGENLSLATQVRDTCAAIILLRLADERMNLVPALEQSSRRLGDAVVDELPTEQRGQLLWTAPPWIARLLADHWDVPSPWRVVAR